MSEKGELIAQPIDEANEDDKIAFNPNDWEEVPFSVLNAPQSAVSSNAPNPNDSDQVNEKLPASEELAQTATQSNSTTLPSQQLFLFEYGKKFTKYKKYKHFEQFFHEKYERNLYFDPSELHFFTPDGLKFKATPGNSVGTSLLYESSSKQLLGFSNSAYNLELSTANKELSDQIEQANKDGESSSAIAQNKSLVGQNEHDPQGNNDEMMKNSTNASNAQQAQKPTNTLESIFDWIEKKDKLNKKRIQKQNKIRSSLKDNGISNESAVSSAAQSKKIRSMNYFIRKLEK